MGKANMAEDPRIDPRIKAVFANLDLGPSADVQNRQEILAAANSEDGRAAEEFLQAFLAMSDNEDIAPSAGLDISDHELVSEPDGNTIKLCLMRPQSPDRCSQCGKSFFGAGGGALSSGSQ
jgi:hypothetical protein